MKRDTTNYLMVGSFVVVAGIALFVLLLAVTGRSGPADTYYVYYKNVSGLKFGTGVFYEGYRVGQIESIEPETVATGMQYRIELSIMQGWKIPADSVARVQSSGLISAVNIQIAEGTSQEFHQPGATLAGEGQSDLFAVLSRAAGDFRTLSEEGVLPVLRNVNNRVTQLAEEMIRFRREDLTPLVRMLHQRIDEDLVNETVELLNHLDDSAIGLKALVNEDNRIHVEAFLRNIDHAASNLNGLVTRIETTRLQMNGVLASLGELVTENSNQVKGTVDAAEVSMEELERALKTVNQHLGTIMHNLEGSSRHMGEFARVIRENPSRLLRNSSASQPGTP